MSPESVWQIYRVPPRLSSQSTKGSARPLSARASWEPSITRHDRTARALAHGCEDLSRRPGQEIAINHGCEANGWRVELEGAELPCDRKQVIRAQRTQLGQRACAGLCHELQ